MAPPLGTNLLTAGRRILGFPMTFSSMDKAIDIDRPRIHRIQAAGTRDAAYFQETGEHPELPATIAAGKCNRNCDRLKPFLVVACSPQRQAKKFIWILNFLPLNYHLTNDFPASEKYRP
jgi:hypothetical protein